MMQIIGLMSGTSLDGIDAALTRIQGPPEFMQLELLGFQTYPYPPVLRQKLLNVCAGKAISLEQLASLDDQVAQAFAAAAMTLQEQFGPAELIGSHGQTIFHRPPNNNLGCSWQIGRGEAIAHFTGLPTVSNFRSADLAAGGQGAPLVPKVDAYLLADLDKHRCVQNFGGIGNVTYLPPRSQPNWSKQVMGWDTGPGNVLMDLAIQQLTKGKQTYDKDGLWAAQGKPDLELVEQWLADPFLQQAPPKSTGREYFGLPFLTKCWQQAQDRHLSVAGLLATLTEFTVRSVLENYRLFLPQMPDEILLCGGGARNSYLRDRLQDLAGEIPVLITDDAGVDHDAKEAIAFAVLAYWRYAYQFPGNLPKVTGAKQPMLLGDIHRVL